MNLSVSEPLPALCWTSSYIFLGPIVCADISVGSVPRNRIRRWFAFPVLIGAPKWPCRFVQGVFFLLFEALNFFYFSVLPLFSIVICGFCVRPREAFCSLRLGLFLTFIFGFVKWGFFQLYSQLSQYLLLNGLLFSCWFESTLYYQLSVYRSPSGFFFCSKDLLFYSYINITMF